jgi:predicted dipeptidase
VHEPPETAGDEVIGGAPAREEWLAVCEEPLATRMSAARALVRREALASGEVERSRALAEWRPRTTDLAAERAEGGSTTVAIGAARRVLQLCGERDAIALTTELVRFQTVAAIAPPETNAEHARMAAFLEGWAREHGLTWRNVGANDAWEMELAGATEARSLAYVFHADVVPVNDPPALVAEAETPPPWTSPPFEAEVRDGRLYGRGTEDDKGPMAAAMVVVATLASAGLVPERGSIVLVAGTAEEDDWSGMRRYAASEPHAEHVVSVDSEFPVVVAESGFVAWGLRVPRAEPRRGERRAVALSARGGLFLTQVPDEAELRVAPPRGQALAAFARRVRTLADAEIAERGDAAFRIDVAEDGDAVRIVARGQSAHSSTAEEGRNAIWLLSGVASRLSLAPSAVATALAIVHDVFDGDHHGERLGVRYEDELMGPLLVAPTVLRTEETEVRLSINMRRPLGATSDELRARLGAAVETIRARFGAEVSAYEGDDVYVGEPHVADTDGDLVPTLMAVYRLHTGDRTAAPISIRGGTYARLFPGAVDFGPALPGHRYTGHQADEHIDLETLRATVAMLFDASLRLTGIGE